MYAELEEHAGWGGREVAELREEIWKRALNALMRRAGKTKANALRAPKGAKWKVSIARELRSRSTRQTHGSPNDYPWVTPHEYVT
jgi:hypothetical protein